MASKGRHASDVTDILQEIMGLLAEAQTAPDAAAHMDVIHALQQGIAQYIQADRQKTRAQATGMGQPGQSPGGPPGAGGPPGMMGGLRPPPGMASPMSGPPGGGGAMPPQRIAPGGGAGMSGFGTPNPDELRRTLAGPAAVGGRAF